MKRYYRVSLLTIALACMVTAATAQDQPTIIKDWVQLTAYTVNHQKGNYDYWTWLPRIDFRVNGPIESGSQLYVEVGYPGAPKWVTFDCDTGTIQKNYWWKTSCGGRDGIAEEKGSTYTGPVTFAIKMRNELAGKDTTLFTGKAKIVKAKNNEYGPKTVNKFVYWADHDWNLPIGYVFLRPNDVHGWKSTNVNLAFWIRGDNFRFEPHLFYQGKEIGRQFFEGSEMGKPTCGPELENGTTHYVEETVPQKARWARIVCTFYNVYGNDDTGELTTLAGPKFLMNKNPGEYELKVLWNNKLARTIKFTVQPGGKFENGIGPANKLGNDRVIVPVTILGDQDGPWDKNAWKDAFYGNPLTGFTAAQ